MYKKPEIETQVVKPPMSTKVDDLEYRMITEESEKKLDSCVVDIINHISFNIGMGQTEQVKDDLYANAKKLWNEYVTELKSTKFTLHLNKKQFDHLMDLLRDEMEYDVNTLFFAIELTDLLGKWVIDENDKDMPKVKSYDADPISVSYLYHLISTVKVKGLTDETYTFSNILRRIHDLNRIVNFYDNHAKNLSKDIQEWVANFEPEQPNYNGFN